MVGRLGGFGSEGEVSLERCTILSDSKTILKTFRVYFHLQLPTPEI
jgi:hypothetical protein